MIYFVVFYLSCKTALLPFISYPEICNSDFEIIFSVQVLIILTHAYVYTNKMTKVRF